jgi:hypothetical protein
MRFFPNRLLPLICVCASLSSLAALACNAQNNPTPRTPSDVVREFYKAMREHRYRDAFSLTSYKPAVEGLNAEEMELLRPGFEEKAAAIPANVEITGEQITGNNATVFVKVPVNETSPQVTSQPLNLIKSGNDWIILFGTEADAAEIKKAGRRYFLDALIEGHEADVEDFLKRLVIWEGIYNSQHNGLYGDFNALMQAGMFSNDVIDPKLSGYQYSLTLASDAKAYTVSAQPTRHGQTGKMSYWMDQTGAIKSADNGGKPLKP